MSYVGYEHQDFFDTLICIYAPVHAPKAQEALFKPNPQKPSLSTQNKLSILLILCLTLVFAASADVESNDTEARQEALCRAMDYPKVISEVCSHIDNDERGLCTDLA